MRDSGRRPRTTEPPGVARLTLLQRRSLTRAILAALTRSRQTHDTGDSASRSATGIEVHAIVGGGNMGTLRTLFKVE
jgi:hypothetical protein